MQTKYLYSMREDKFEKIQKPSLVNFYFEKIL